MKTAQTLKSDLRQILNDGKAKIGTKEDKAFTLLQKSMAKIGDFYSRADGSALFFRRKERKLYELDTKPQSEFGRLVTYLTDVSVKDQALARALDRLTAKVTHQAPAVDVHAVAYNTPECQIIAINDYDGGMWRRERGGAWEWKPNGTDGILFWTPSAFVDRWSPDFSRDPTSDKSHLEWPLEQPHFADDVLTISDQRRLLRACLLAPFFPALCKTRPIQAHLGLGQSRQHDTGKTMAGKMIGYLLVGEQFLPTPLKTEEDLQLTLMNQPFVLLDNVDTEIPWLNDFLATYATGARPTKRKHYENTVVVYFENRGRLCVTSRRAKFNREDVATRIVPFRFRPISAAERRTEPELLEPILARRGHVWAGLLSLVAEIQDALPSFGTPPSSLRLADFDALGWRVAKLRGEETGWPEIMRRLQSAQAGFALEDEPLFPILQELLKTGDLPERSTSELFERVRQTAATLNLDPPKDTASCTKRLNERRELMESRLDVKISTRTLNGQTLITITRGPSWEQPEVTEVTDSSNISRKEEGRNER